MDHSEKVYMLLIYWECPRYATQTYAQLYPAGMLSNFPYFSLDNPYF